MWIRSQRGREQPWYVLTEGQMQMIKSFVASDTPLGSTERSMSEALEYSLWSRNDI